MTRFDFDFKNILAIIVAIPPSKNHIAQPSTEDTVRRRFRRPEERDPPGTRKSRGKVLKSRFTPLILPRAKAHTKNEEGQSLGDLVRFCQIPVAHCTLHLPS